MSSFKLESSGSFSSLENFLTKMSRGEIFKVLKKYGKEGVDALSKNTPLDSGDTRNAWDFEVTNTRRSHTITWTNDHKTADGEPIAIILQYGHGTGTGGYVQGRDYINPAMRPVFDNIAEKVWKAVTSA
jgi:hypothetical protein